MTYPLKCILDNKSRQIPERGIFASVLSLIPLSVQVKLLKILALLGRGDKQASENMYAVLEDVMRKSDSSTNIGNAVFYECVCCVSSIYPNRKLLEAAADVVAKFLKVCFGELFFYFKFTQCVLGGFGYHV